MTGAISGACYFFYFVGNILLKCGFGLGVIYSRYIIIVVGVIEASGNIGFRAIPSLLKARRGVDGTS